MNSPHPCPPPPCPDVLASSSFFDLVVVGSGPAALAVVTRILESRPAALYTDEEHAHLHWLRRSSIPRPLLQVRRTGRGQEKVLDGVSRGAVCPCDGAMRILVVDRLGGWMANWDRLFAAYEIAHLRSPMFFHPAPADVDSLVAFSQRTGQNKTRLASDGGRAPVADDSFDLVEIPGCVGKEVSKHKRKQARKAKGPWAPVAHSMTMGPAVSERDRKDYFTPSTALFRDFIQSDLVQRYGLDNKGKPWSTAADALGAGKADDGDGQLITLVKGDVAALEWGPLHIKGWDHMDGFSMRLACGTCIGAKAVVCATGPGVTPAVPAYLAANGISCASGPGWCHSTVLGSPGKDLPPAELVEKERVGVASTLVVIGGGLTSAQICDVAIRGGVSHVILILRGYMKVKPFDVGLEWIGRYSNLEMMRFWQENDLDRRRETLMAAQNGGSITPNYAKLLKHYQDQGKLRILDCTVVTAAACEPVNGGDRRQWHVELVEERRGKGQASSVASTLTADYIIAATGAAPRFSDVPFLSAIAGKHSVAEHGGLPALSDSLQYGSLPLFFTGAFSALQIGPGAFNLSGMRAAADRIAVRLEEMALGGGAPAATQADEGTPSSTVQDSRSHYTHFAFHCLPEEVPA